MRYSKERWYKPTKLSTKLVFVGVLLIFIRLLSNIPVPYINREYLELLFSSTSAYDLLNSFSGGAFTKMSFMALGVTPYISASIILQLLTVAFPKLKEYQEGDYNKKKWKIVTICTSIALGIMQSIGVSITFGRQGLIVPYNFLSCAVICLLWVLGGIIVVLIGEYITKYCIGNGISIILAANIISEMPRDVLNFWQVYVNNKNALQITVASIITVAVVIAVTALTVVLNGAEKNVPIMYSGSYKNYGANKSSIPLKLNSVGVMPVIFASTIFSVPLMFINSSSTVGSVITRICNMNGWYSVHNWLGFIGTLLYFVFIIAFAYFYSAISFNTMEIANNLKKNGAVIPGIRPGKSTEEYLYNKNKNMTFIAAICLFVITQIPTLITSLSRIGSLSFSGTAIIIIVGVVLETATTIKANTISNTYKANSKLFGLKATTQRS